MKNAAMLCDFVFIFCMVYWWINRFNWLVVVIILMINTNTKKEYFFVFFFDSTESLKEISFLPVFVCVWYMWISNYQLCERLLCSDLFICKKHAIRNKNVCVCLMVNDGRNETKNKIQWKIPMMMKRNWMKIFNGQLSLSLSLFNFYLNFFFVWNLEYMIM